MLFHKKSPWISTGQLIKFSLCIHIYRNNTKRSECSMGQQRFICFKKIPAFIWIIKKKNVYSKAFLLFLRFWNTFQKRNLQFFRVPECLFSVCAFWTSFIQQQLNTSSSEAILIIFLPLTANKNELKCFIYTACVDKNVIRKKELSAWLSAFSSLRIKK